MKKLNIQVVLAILAILSLVLVAKAFTQNSINNEFDSVIGNTSDVEVNMTFAGEAGESELEQELALELGPEANTEVDANLNLVQSKELTKVAGEVGVNQVKESGAVEQNKTAGKTNNSPAPSEPKEKSEKLPTHQVVKGESLFLISRNYGITVAELKSLNKLTSDEITVGQVLSLPAGAKAASPAIQTASRSSINHQFNDNDLYWLAKIIHAEARGESYEGQVAVGAVIINRVKSANFPNTVYGVIFEKWDNKFYQFSPVLDGTINLEPNQSAKRAARDVVSGYDPTGGALYFYNPAKSTNKWIFDRPIIKRIGKHVFAR